ncbi:MAG TPA: hypothetical protein VGD05_07090, partial [Pyrinomonadaceae bacterium]
MTDVNKAAGEFEISLLSLVGDNVSAGCDCNSCETRREHLKNSNLIFGAHYIKVENCRLYSTATTYWIDENLDHSL